MNVKQSAYYLCCNEVLAQALINNKGMAAINQRQAISDAFIMDIGTPVATMMQSAYEVLFVDTQFPFSTDSSFFHMESVDGVGRKRIYSARDVENEEWYRETLRYDAQVYAFTYRQGGNKVLFSHLLRNIYLTDPRYSDVAGVVLYSMPADAVNGILRNDQMSEGSVSLLLFNDQLLGSTNETLFPCDGTADMDFLLGRLPGEGEVATLDFHGVSYGMSAQSVNNRWKVVVMTPTANMHQSVLQLLPLLLPFVLILIVVSLSISVMFSRRLSSPIRRLSDAMVRARKAQALPQKIPVVKSDAEIEYLYHSYNEIVDNIHRISELERAQMGESACDRCTQQECLLKEKKG